MFKSCLISATAALAAAKDGSDFNGSAYTSLSRKEKSDKIWAKVTENTTSGWWHLQGALIVDEDPVFDTPGDELVCGWTGCRNKSIHAQGSVAKAIWHDLGGHPYTGIFKGADAGYVRLSVAKPTITIPGAVNLAPGMGAKFLRDGTDSANFVAMYSVDGQSSLNFFENDFSNHIPDAKSKALKPLERHFSFASKYIQTVGLSDMAAKR